MQLFTRALSVFAFLLLASPSLAENGLFRDTSDTNYVSQVVVVKSWPLGEIELCGALLTEYRANIVKNGRAIQLIIAIDNDDLKPGVRFAVDGQGDCEPGIVSLALTPLTP